MKHGIKLDIVNFYNAEVGNPELPGKFKQVTKDEKTKADRLAVARRRKRIFIVAALLLGMAATVAFWAFFGKPPSRPTTEPVSDKSVAVLP
jgi:hypothetical protein